MIIITLSGHFHSTDADRDNFYFLSFDELRRYTKDASRPLGFARKVGSDFTDIWARDEGWIFVTSSGGVYTMPKPPEINENFSDTLTLDSSITGGLDSSVCLCVDGLNRNLIAVGTISGVNVILNGETVFNSQTLSPVVAVKFVETGDLLYGGSFGLAKKVGPFESNWTNPDFVAGLDLLPNINVNAIDVVRLEEENTIAVATNDGIAIVSERDPLFLSPTLHFFKE